MPSLHELEEFKSSFESLGGELLSMEKLELPHDDLPLPDHEAATAPKSISDDLDTSVIESAEDVLPADGGAQKEAGSDFINFGDLGDLLGGAGAQTGDTQDGYVQSEDGESAELSAQEESLSEFIDNIPDEFSSDDLSVSDFSSSETPPGLLDGLADEIESEREEQPSPEEEFGSDDIDASDLGGNLGIEDSGAQETNVENTGTASAETFSFDDLDILSSGEAPDTAGGETEEEILAEAEPFESIDSSESAEPIEPIDSEEPSAAKGEAFPDFDLDGSLELAGEDPFSPVESGNGGDMSSGSAAENEPEDSKKEEFSKFDLGDFSATDAAKTFESETETQDFDEAESAETGAGEKAEAVSGAAESDNFDFSGENIDFSNAILEEIPGDSFDNFSVDSGALAGNFDMGQSEDELASGFQDDFSIPGIPGMGKASKKKSRAKTASSDLGYEVEEINLTNEELDQLQATLSSYPLNLRIACQEIIAEMAVAPDKLSRLIKLLVNGAPAKETAALAGQIMQKTISIPKGSEKKTGEELEAEKSSFAYIFVHNFLPVLRLFLVIAIIALSAGYLAWRFVYKPLRADKIYKYGIEHIETGEYGRASERFWEAYRIHSSKKWFYKYARSFRDARQYTLSEEMYEELLFYTASKNKRNIPEKKAVLEYADLETNYIGNYEAADKILRRNILDFEPYDREALLALGDNALIWGEYEPARYEEANEAYGKYIERYGRTDPVLERMLKYFIRTDNLEQVIYLQSYFMASAKRIISADTLAELGGYLLDKRYEEVRGVPNEYLDSIGGIREVLLRAIKQDQRLPESYYHLARYYNYYENRSDEERTLEVAVRAFEMSEENNAKRIKYHINTLRRYGEMLLEEKKFFQAEEVFIKAVAVYQDALSRRLLAQSPEFGKIYTALGDLEYFKKEGDWRKALEYYRQSEQSGWAPPEVLYRMGASHYQLREWGPALDRLFAAFRQVPPNRRILYALGNVSYMRGNYFAAQGYYDKLLEILEADRSRLSPIMATDDENELDLAERLMIAQNNLGVTLDALTERTGNNKYRTRAQGLYAESERAWDILTRNPKSMIRTRSAPGINTPSPGVNAAYLNIRNSLRPLPNYEPILYIRIDRDMFEPSIWEELSPPEYRLSSEDINTRKN